MALPLPTELLYYVVDMLPVSDQRTCLAVSKLLHDRAVRRLFSTVQLYFGQSNEDASPEHTQYRAVMVWDIIYRIVRDPSFATVVTKLVVHMHTYDLSSLTFQQCCLTEVVISTPNLQTFAWCNNSLGLTDLLRGTLATRCPSLRHLQIPLYSALSAGSSGLRTLAFHHQPLYPGPNTIVQRMIESNITTIRSLSIPGNILWSCPIRLFDNLTELDLELDKNIENMAMVFRHSTCLQTLTLQYFRTAELHYVFGQCSTSLPRLTSLKMLFKAVDSHADQWVPVAEFIRCHPNLRRLDLQSGINWAKCPVIELLPDLKQLEVLGLHLGLDHIVDENQITRLAANVPKNITALHLSVQFFLPTELFLDFVSQLTCLTMLYIEAYNLTYPELLSRVTSPHLTSLGVGGDTWNVEGLEVVIPKWDTDEYHFRQVEDFAYKDHEWLLRYHALA